jgi:hypothetical protein
VVSLIFLLPCVSHLLSLSDDDDDDDAAAAWEQSAFKNLEQPIQCRNRLLSFVLNLSQPFSSFCLCASSQQHLND